MSTMPVLVVDLGGTGIKPGTAALLGASHVARFGLNPD